MAGLRLGWALDVFGQRHASIAALLTDLLEQWRLHPDTRPEGVSEALGEAFLWLAHNDARGYLLLGDPAVRPAFGPDAASGDPPWRRSDVHALVVGVDFYLPGEVAGAIYPPLRGCVADAREVALYLKAELGAPEGNVRLLTATRGDGGSPAEPPGQRPDYDTLTAALADLVAAARPETKCSSTSPATAAGCRPWCPRPRVRPASTSAWCRTTPTPAPACCGTSKIAAMVAGMAERGLYVTLALDCCHAGGALKAPPEQAAVRGVPFVNDPPRVADSAIARPRSSPPPGGRPAASARGAWCCWRPADRASWPWRRSSPAACAESSPGRS